jgi:hypothetical protein
VTQEVDVIFFFFLSREEVFPSAARSLLTLLLFIFLFSMFYWFLTVILDAMLPRKTYAFLSEKSLLAFPSLFLLPSRNASTVARSQPIFFFSVRASGHTRRGGRAWRSFLGLNKSPRRKAHAKELFKINKTDI